MMQVENLAACSCSTIVFTHTTWHTVVCIFSLYLRFYKDVGCFSYDAPMAHANPETFPVCKYKSTGEN